MSTTTTPPKSWLYADQALDVASSTANWSDYSTVFAPIVAPSFDFHGVHTLGQSIDFQEATPFMLFSFALKGGYVGGVRLFVNGQDPDSKQKGMIGGDFANTVQNYKGIEFYKSGVSQADLAKLISATSDEKEPAISVYPNPVTGDAVSVTAQRFPSNERLTLRMYSSTSVELSSVEENVDKLNNYQLRLPKQLSQQGFLYVERNAGVMGK